MWTEWLHRNWPALCSGRKIEVPSWLPHPRTSGFRQLEMATPLGQVGDWAVSLPDGSRLHVQEYLGGRQVAHRDRYDPDRGIGHAVSHLLGETFVGPLLVAVGVLALARAHANG